MGLSSLLGVSAKTVDSSLDALFNPSVGPAKLDKTPVTRYKKQTAASASNDDENDGDNDEVIGSDKKENEDKEGVNETVKKCKRRRKQENEDLETKYLEKLAAEDDEEEGKLKKRIKGNNEASEEIETAEDAESDPESDTSEDLVHESLKDTAAPVNKNNEIEKANRTVFLANIATDAATKKSQKKALLAHLSTILDTKATPAETIESIRFRSLAFSTISMPKRAAYITKSTQEATAKSCNAYVVYSTPAAMRKACTELNGSIVLNRHLRVDSVAHPAPTDGRRCIFVGNLGFVDDEFVFTTDPEGNPKRKKRNKVPSDIEEGLWQVFSEHAGKVESVRVIRDPKTRVGKGIAYVQFYDANHVEKALLLNGKKFPPMLPRKLRVARTKDPRKTANALRHSHNKAISAEKAKTASKTTLLKHTPKTTVEEQSIAGRATKLLGQSSARRQVRGEKHVCRSDRLARASGSGAGARRQLPTIQNSEKIILEGRRASEKDGKPNDIKFNKKGNGGVRKKRPTGRRAQRSQEWKKSGGK